MSDSAVAPTILIGVNHSGSWSAKEALSVALGKERCFDAEAYSNVEANVLPTTAMHLQHECARINAMPQFPTLINSHFPLPLHLGFPNRELRYMTMLRNPTKRFISYYHWARLHKDKSFHWVSPAIRQGATLEEYVEHVLKTAQFPSGLTPGHYFFDSWLQCGLMPAEYDNNRMVGAAYILDRYFSVVGITEMYDESLYVLSKALGLKSPAKWRMQGKSGADSSTVPQHVIDKIKPLIEVDNAIYQAFVQRFLDRHRQDIEEFKSLGISLRLEGDSDEIRTMPESWANKAR